MIGFEGGVTDAINLTGFNDAVRLGARTGTTVTLTASNVITPPGTTYRLGGGGGTISVQSVLSDSNSGARNVDVGTSGNLAAGLVVLAGANTYSGTATVSAGTLEVGSNGGPGRPAPQSSLPTVRPSICRPIRPRFRWFS